jgi:hypothetical protein
MPNDEEAEKAMAGLDGKELKGRARTVNEARKNNPRNHSKRQELALRTPSKTMLFTRLREGCYIAS